ncbi:MAG: MerR family DNA-binding transcriptional regulator [Vicinamibacterales bacterium]
MQTGEVAARAGVNIQTLRYYERRGLLGRPPRTASGYRRYSETPCASSGSSSGRRSSASRSTKPSSFCSFDG